MEKQLKEALSAYEIAHKKAIDILKKYPELIEKLNLDITKVLNPLKVRLGLPGFEANEFSSKRFPKITVLNKKDFKEVELKKSFEENFVKSLNSEEAEIEDLKKQVDSLEKNFMALESSIILNDNADMAIRGVAKRAGLPVTEDNPKKIDLKYIETIKETILKNNGLNKHDS